MGSREDRAGTNHPPPTDLCAEGPGSSRSDWGEQGWKHNAVIRTSLRISCSQTPAVEPEQLVQLRALGLAGASRVKRSHREVPSPPVCIPSFAPAQKVYSVTQPIAGQRNPYLP